MWLAGSKASLYIATDQVVLQLPGRARQVWSDQPWSEGLLLAAEAMKTARHRKVAVWLSGGLARPFLIPVVEGIRRWKDVEQLAQATAPNATQIQAAVEVWIGRWSGETPSLAVATPTALHDALEQLCASHKLRIALLRPAWHWAAAAAPADARLILLHERDACTALKSDQKKVRWVNSAVPAPSLSGMNGQMARMAFAQDVSASETIWGALGPSDHDADNLPTSGAPIPPLDLKWQPNAD